MNDMVPAQFQLIFTEYYPFVVRKITGLIPDRTIVEDLAQEVFLKLYRHPPNDLISVGAWLHRVSMTAAYDYLRLVGRRRNLQQKEELAFQTHSNAADSNEDLAIRNWELEVVKSVLRKLSLRDREALVLKEEGYSYAEIADRLQVNPKIVGALLKRANERFRRKYVQEEAGNK